MHILKIPKKLKNKYLKSYINIGDMLLSDKKCRAAIISKSIIENPDKNSDLDIVVITNKNFWQRKQISINNVFIELFYYSPKELIKSFKEKEYQDMHMVAYGFVMFDKDGCLDKIKKIAKKLYKKGPCLIDKEKITYSKYLVWDRHQDVIDILKKDKDGALALMHKSLWEASELFFNLQNKWFCKPKKLLPSIKKVDKNLYFLFKKFYSFKEKNIMLLYKIYRQIISEIIKPNNIDEYFQWNGKKHRGKF